MAIVRGCRFPDDLYYDVPHHVWYRPAQDGLVQLGITPVGVALAREVLVYTPKRVGRNFDAGKAVATVESAKWIGSVRAAFGGVVAVVNDALVARAAPVNADCYGAGWMMLVRPSENGWQEATTAGSLVAGTYEAWMEENGFAGCGA